MGEGVRGGILKLDESGIGDSRLENADWTASFTACVQFELSNLESPMQDSSNFKISSLTVTP